jgi:hypothetical protein
MTRACTRAKPPRARPPASSGCSAARRSSFGDVAPKRCQLLTGRTHGRRHASGASRSGTSTTASGRCSDEDAEERDAGGVPSITRAACTDTSETTRATSRDPKLRRLAGAWGRKWHGRWRYEVGDGGFEHEHGRALVFEVEPTKVFAFGKGTFSQTRHRFARQPAR